MHILTSHVSSTKLEIGVVTPPQRMENGRMKNGEWGKRGANKIASPWRKCDTPLWPVENGEWLCGETFAQNFFSILHSSPVEEKKFSSFSILQSPRMGPPPFKRACHIPILHSLENGKKEVWQPLMLMLLWLGNVAQWKSPTHLSLKVDSLSHTSNRWP